MRDTERTGSRGEAVANETDGSIWVDDVFEGGAHVFQASRAPMVTDDHGVPVADSRQHQARSSMCMTRTRRDLNKEQWHPALPADRVFYLEFLKVRAHDDGERMEAATDWCGDGDRRVNKKTRGRGDGEAGAATAEAPEIEGDGMVQSSWTKSGGVVHDVLMEVHTSKYVGYETRNRLSRHLTRDVASEKTDGHTCLKRTWHVCTSGPFRRLEITGIAVRNGNVIQHSEVSPVTDLNSPTQKLLARIQTYSESQTPVDQTGILWVLEILHVTLSTDPSFGVLYFCDAAGLIRLVAVSGLAMR
ncbi:hypothetical protein ARMSODRAFT_981018 [Armillaria solidipes]|uniref:Uncharacterized protein n=1 Tax=Armillaria solidipes TaxID=1076256 RepID=A0A2H3AWY0_9AGAR|nr:hypothetical protein ARMSODRAFT_981018 [Armillaria solidipes]